VSVDAWTLADPIGCPVCGREACEDHLPDDAERQNQLTTALERERLKREVRRLVDREERGPVIIPPFLSLRERVRLHHPTVTFRIDRWQPRGSRVMLAAQYKAGKTTVTNNLIRSLVDGDSFMSAPVVPLTGRLTLVDLEMGETQLDAWLADQRIRNDDQVWPISLRGKAGTFDLLDPQVRADWALKFREAQTDYLILDCLRPVLDVLGLEEKGEAGRFLVAFDALLAEAQIPEALVVHHMGHTGDRARGDSRLRDWPDVEWRLVRADDDPASARFLSAFGRDVEVPENQLAFDPLTRRLTLIGGSRQDARTHEALDAVVEFLATAPEPLSGRQVKAALADSGFGKGALDKALKVGEKERRLLGTTGKRRARLYQVSRSVPPVSQGHSGDRESESVPLPYIGQDTRTLTGKDWPCT
jgi:hypothetical protein